MTLELKVSTGSRMEMRNITAQVQEAVGRSGIRDGLAVVFVPHTTAGVTINESADPDVTTDILSHVSKAVPRRAGYRHAEGNSDSHILASFFGSSVNVIVEEGRLKLGTWQGIFFCEFDGPRSRKVWVKVIGD
jgi:secondary thiamine-phosphate synthase enzyme